MVISQLEETLCSHLWPHHIRLGFQVCIIIYKLHSEVEHGCSFVICGQCTMEVLLDTLVGNILKQNMTLHSGCVCVCVCVCVFGQPTRIFYAFLMPME